MNKHHKLIIAWFIISGLIVFTAVRQIQVAAANQIQAHQPIPPPTKTRHAFRTAVLPWSGDPAADYVVRCEKGMTDKEIGWILEDFRIAGLDRFAFTDKTPDDELLAYRIAQQRWYLGALVDGLRLAPDQAAQAAAKLNELFKTVATEFRRKSESGKLDAPVVTRFDMIVPYFWIFSGYGGDDPGHLRFLPWDLCLLTSKQEAITWKKEFSAGLDQGIRDGPTAHPLFKNPHPLDHDAEMPEQWALVDAVFPFLKSQSFAKDQIEAEDSGKSLLIALHDFHPAQLKILLLIYPHLAAEIQSALALDQANK